MQLCIFSSYKSTDSGEKEMAATAPYSIALTVTALHNCTMFWLYLHARDKEKWKQYQVWKIRNHTKTTTRFCWFHLACQVHLVHQVHYPILYIRWVYLAWAIGEGTQVARCPLCYLSTPDSIYTIRDVGQISGRD